MLVCGLWLTLQASDQVDVDSWNENAACLRKVGGRVIVHQDKSAPRGLQVNSGTDSNRALPTMMACAFVAEFVDAQVVKTLGSLGVVGSSPTARAVFATCRCWKTALAVGLEPSTPRDSHVFTALVP